MNRPASPTSSQSKHKPTIIPNKALETGEREIALEIYRQKGDMFRHFDSLRWQVPIVTFAAASLVITSGTDANNVPAWWAFCLSGLLTALGGFAVFRIRDGIRKNHDSLREVAELLGNHSIPARVKYGATWWLMLILLSLGWLATALGILRGLKVV